MCVIGLSDHHRVYIVALLVKHAAEVVVYGRPLLRQPLELHRRAPLPLVLRSRVAVAAFLPMPKRLGDFFLIDVAHGDDAIHARDCIDKPGAASGDSHQHDPQLVIAMRTPNGSCGRQHHAGADGCGRCEKSAARGRMVYGAAPMGKQQGERFGESRSFLYVVVALEQLAGTSILMRGKVRRDPRTVRHFDRTTFGGAFNVPGERWRAGRSRRKGQ
jgi:hypothetical protein